MGLSLCTRFFIRISPTHNLGPPKDKFWLHINTFKRAIMSCNKTHFSVVMSIGNDGVHEKKINKLPNSKISWKVKDKLAFYIGGSLPKWLL